MRKPRIQMSVDPEFLSKVLVYAAEDDRTVAELMIHAARQYMRRYPLESKQGPREEEE